MSPRPKAPETGAERLVLGEIVGAHGVRGAVKLVSWTRPRSNLFAYPVWQLETPQALQSIKLLRGWEQGKGLVAELEGVDNRDAALALRGARITIERTALPAKAPGEFYWVELQGLAVETVDGQALGTVTGLMETGANDVLIVGGERERLIPYLPGDCVREVDLAGGRLVVDWDPEF